MSTHSFYFKIVYTCQTINYDINLDMSITEFINYVSQKARTDFDINDNNIIEIVEAGQFENINGRDAELAPALENSDLTIREKYDNRYKNIAFYIRPLLRTRLSLIIPNEENNTLIAPRF